MLVSMKAAEPVIQGKDATVRFGVQAGPRFEIRGVDMTTICPCLLAQRREAERRGILDFNASVQVASDVALPIRAQKYRIHRG